MNVIYKITIKGLMSVAAVSLCAQTLLAQESDGMPSLHPQPCKVQVDSSGLNVFTNAQCDKYFIAPKAIEKPKNNMNILGSIDLCPTQDKMIETITRYRNLVNTLVDKSQSAFENGDIKKGVLYEELAAKAQKSEQDTTDRYEEFGNIHASTIHSVFQNSVSQADLDNFMFTNRYTFHNAHMYPEIAKIPIENSIYSFTYIREETSTPGIREILSTTIPGLQPLTQPSGNQTEVAHVKAGDVMAGQTRLSLAGTCKKVEKIDGDWEPIKAKLQNIMTVNRSYDVPMRINFWGKAKLNTKIALSTMVDHVMQTKNQGLSKLQFYNKLMNLKGENAFDLSITSDTTITSEQKELIDQGIRKRLVDQFLLFYESRGELASLKPVQLNEPTGGNVPQLQWGKKCWSSSSFFGLKKDGGCYDYQYTVQVWKEGITSTEIEDAFHIDLEISETYVEKDIMPYKMSSAFFAEDEEINNDKEI